MTLDGKPLTRRQCRKIENRFRVWSFHVYYARAFKLERDHVARFVKALLASARPMRNPELVLEWYRNRRKYRDPTDDPGSHREYPPLP